MFENTVSLSHPSSQVTTIFHQIFLHFLEYGNFLFLLLGFEERERIASLQHKLVLLSLVNHLRWTKLLCFDFPIAFSSARGCHSLNILRQPPKHQNFVSTLSSKSEVELGVEASTIRSMKNQRDNHIKSSMISSAAYPLPASSMIGDYIGMESCCDLDSNTADTVLYEKRVQQEKRHCTRRMSMKKKEFPPPIPSLARTENLHSHMPWVLKRYYTNDGRLILREEKVKHHEYFWAQRSNGRLTLHLVPLDDYDYYHYDQPVDEETDQQESEEEVEEKAKISDTKFDNNAKEEDNETMVEDSILKCSVTSETTPTPMENGISAATAIKCFNYSTVRASPNCFLGMPVPAPVQS